MTDTPGSQDPAPTPSRAGRNLPAAIASGVVREEKRLTALPWSEMRNLVKFHLIALLPSSPGARFFNSMKSG